MSVLAIDAGQTGVRLRLDTEDHVAEVAGVIGSGDVQRQLTEAVRTVVRRHGWRPSTVAVGLTGLTAVDASPALLLDAVPSASTALLAHDSVTATLGALGMRDGVVAAAGTGLVALAVGPGGVARIDGHGHLLGDAGSGFWLGRAGIEAALRAHDGRGPASSLVGAAAATYGELDLIGPTLQRDGDRVARIAVFARAVLEAMDDGDAVARTIATAGAQEIAITASTGLGRVDATTDAPVSWTGALLSRSPRYRALLRMALIDLRPGVSLVAPSGDGLDGAAALVDVRADSPLHPHIHRARRREVSS